MKGEVYRIIAKMPKAKTKTKGAPDPPVAPPTDPPADPPAALAADPPAALAAAPPTDPAAAMDAGPSASSNFLTDGEAYKFIKATSREAYKSAWETFRASCAAEREFDARVPSEKELLDYFVILREGRVLENGERVEGRAASTILSTYSLINGVMKHKYSFNLNKFPRIGARLKVWQSEDVKKKAAVFTTEELKTFCESEELQGGYWEVRKAVVILAFFGGLRLTEAMGLELEKISPCAEGLKVIHKRAKGRSDKPSSKFKVPKKKKAKDDSSDDSSSDDSSSNDSSSDDSSTDGISEEKRIRDSFDWAACLGQYIGRVKEELGKYQGRVFYTGRKNGGLVAQPMGRNKLCEVPHEVARFLGKSNPEDFTFHSFRRSSATAAADAGATAQQMTDFFGWKNPSMTAEYISTSNHQLNTMANKLSKVKESKEKGGKEKRRKEKKKKRKRKRDESSSSDMEEEGRGRKKIVKRSGGDKKVVIINM